MVYYFFFGVLPLPITPSELKISSPSLNETIVLINEGEINIPRSPGLCEISFDFLLPSRKYHFSNYSLGDYTATTFIPLLNLMKENKKLFQFIVSRTHGDNQVRYFTNITVGIESLEYIESATDYGTDTLVSITLKEYKEYLTTKYETLTKVAVGTAATVVSLVAQKERSTTSKTVAKTYTVKEGDTLWNICKKELGDGQKYNEVAKLNSIENPDLIYPGQELRLS